MAYESATALTAVRYAQAQIRLSLWEKGLRHRDLADRMGVTQPTASDWLKATRLDIGTLADIARALDDPISRYIQLDQRPPVQNWKILNPPTQRDQMDGVDARHAA